MHIADTEPVDKVVIQNLDDTGKPADIKIIRKNPRKRKKTRMIKKAPTGLDYVSGILNGDRYVLSRAITLIESSAPRHQELAQEVLQAVMTKTGKSRRIGITGVPGVGKSTFIESFGCHLVNLGHKVAVLAIDPSSQRSGGSILGDKTRMERLVRERHAFIRPSPTGGSLGGVARRTRETMMLCEAAGFDVVIVETVGVGQAEITLRSMVDFYLLLLLPGAGDELQAIKKGIVELADAILINKADGDNVQKAAIACADQRGAMGCIPASTEQWTTPVEMCSGLTGAGIKEAWDSICRFYTQLEPRGIVIRRRNKQAIEWMEDLIQEGLRLGFQNDARVKTMLPLIHTRILNGEMTPVKAAEELLKTHSSNAEPIITPRKNKNL